MLDQRLKTRIDYFVSRLEREDVCMHGFILSVGGQIKATAYYAESAGIQEGITQVRGDGTVIKNLTVGSGEEAM